MPPEPDFASMAERRVWEALVDQLPDGAAVVHGLRLSDRRQDREADLVVAWPGVGVAVIEVKGGLVSLEHGRWVQRSKGYARDVHPVDQARACRYMLRDYLDRHAGWRHGRPRLAHLVAVPFTTVDGAHEAPDCPRWMLVGAQDLPDVAARVRDALDLLVDAPPPPTAAEVDDLLECLGGRMVPQRALLDAVAEHEYACDLLTRRQGRVLDLLAHLHRVEVRGGAGSGKTWLAVEKARRLTAAGGRVALVCYSRGLAAYLALRVQTLPPTEQPVYVGTFHGLGMQWLGAPAGADDDSTYWEETLPASMAGLAQARPADDRFDAFVVDEAQDFADSWWPALLAGLREPETGGLYLFADERQRVFGRSGRPPVAVAPVVLDENLRNTQQIAQVFGSLAPSQMRYRGGEGEAVRFVPCPSSQAVGVASDQAVALLEDGWAGEHVALLTTGPRHPVQVEQQQEGHEAYWRSCWSGEDLFYGHVLGFKGLERPAVVLAVNGFRNRDRAPEMLYVGLSRARDLLVVCGDPQEIADVGGPAVARRLGLS